MEKKRVKIVVIGQKDHGKSTLIGRLLYETASLSKNKLKEIERLLARSDSFQWAHLLDAFQYEKNKEMTLDATRAFIKIGGEIYEFIDIPGHKELIKNMASGAWEADGAILMIDANEGIKDQTLEHLEIVKFLGIKDVVVAINKLDLVNYSYKRFVALKKEIGIIFKKQSLRTPTIIPVVAKTGDNFQKKSKDLQWFKGPTLIQAVKKEFNLKNINPTKSKNNFLMAVQDIYPPSLIIGKIINGRIKIGAKLRLISREKLYVLKNVFINSRPVTKASSNESVGLILEPTPQNIQRGDILTTSKRVIQTRVIRGDCIFFDKATGGEILLEINFKEAGIEKISMDTVTLNRPTKAKLILKKHVVPYGTFVIRNSRAIIGIGKIKKL